MILLHNFTGHVLSKRGLSKCLAALVKLEDQMLLETLGKPVKWLIGIPVDDVETMNKIMIQVRIDRHGLVVELARYEQTASAPRHKR